MSKNETCGKKPMVMRDGTCPGDYCPMMETYSRCDECPKYVDGYPAKKCLKHCVNGFGYIAYSTVPNNKAPVEDYIGNTDGTKPWVVMKQCEFWPWLIEQATEGFLTKAEIKALISTTPTPTPTSVVKCTPYWTSPIPVPRFPNDAALEAVRRGSYTYEGTLADVLAATGTSANGGSQTITPDFPITITKAQLESIGMRPTDNSVNIEIRANHRFDNETGTNADNQVLNSLLLVEGCANYQKSVNGDNAIMPDGQTVESEGSSNRITVDVPLAADGSITLTAKLDPDLSGEIEFVNAQYVYIVNGFFNQDPANLCYKGAAPDCVGVKAGNQEI